MSKLHGIAEGHMILVHAGIWLGLVSAVASAIVVGNLLASIL